MGKTSNYILIYNQILLTFQCQSKNKNVSDSIVWSQLVMDTTE